MSNFNKVILMGRLTRQPELTVSAGSGIKFCRFALAVNGRPKSDGAEEVFFAECVAFRKSGEVIAQYANKGATLLVEGGLHTSKWKTKDGEDRTRTEVIVENFQFVGSRASAAAETAERANGPDRSVAAADAGEDNPF